MNTQRIKHHLNAAADLVQSIIDDLEMGPVEIAYVMSRIGSATSESIQLLINSGVLITHPDTPAE